MHAHDEAFASPPCAARLLVQETYRLVQPRVGALAADARTMRDAGLLPSVLLHFQRDDSHSGGLDRMPALSQALLMQAKPSN